MFQIIRGTFHVKGFQPDGDSIRFLPEKAGAWAALNWPKGQKKPSRRVPIVQLRLEGIDALEIHYEGFHQPRSLALRALEVLLDLIGITNLTYSITATTIIGADDGKPGFIAVSEVDVFGRPVSLLFPADAPLENGQSLDAADLPWEVCVNLKLCSDGLAYPTFYTSTDATVVRLFAQEARAAREAKRGLWVLDRSMGFTMWDIRTIFDDATLMPKLFRRLVSFCQRYENMADLPAYLAEKGDTVQLADGRKVGLSELMTVRGKFIGLKRPPEELVFVPR